MTTDPYPEEMMKSVRKVEETRPDRADVDLEKYKKEPDAREEILEGYHPDYKPEAFGEIGVGPNKGDVAPLEVAKLFESYPLIDPDNVDLNEVDYDVDVLIIGGGGAGTSAAIWAYREGVNPEKILISTKLRHGDSNSVMAQGGTQAATSEDDSPPIHYLDTIGGGHFENKPELVEALVKDAPKIIKWHKELGVIYDRVKDGSFMHNPGGGASRKRLHCCEDYTGMEQMRDVRDRARNIGIRVLEFSPAVELLTNGDGNVSGAVLWNLETEQYYVVKAKSTIMATGGFGRLHIQDFPTTNHYGATADGLVMAYRAGAKMRDLDTVQYHPTGAAFPGQILGLLVTEKVRSMGGQPVNREGEAFVYPLEPRDIEAATIIKECEKGRGIETPIGSTGVWLDSPIVDEIHGDGTFEENFPSISRLFNRQGIDPTEYPILVYPTLHYQNGGIEINANTETSIGGLLAAGEVSGGVHGKNRLMGNSTLDCYVFGRRAGLRAAELVEKGKDPDNLSLAHAKSYRKKLQDLGVNEGRKSPVILPDYRGEKPTSRALELGL